MSRRDEIRRQANEQHIKELNAILNLKQNSNQNEPIVTGTKTTEDEKQAILAALNINLANGIVPNGSKQNFAICGKESFRLEQGVNKPTFEIQRNNSESSRNSKDTTIAVVKYIDGLQGLINDMPNELSI